MVLNYGTIKPVVNFFSSIGSKIQGN